MVVAQRVGLGGVVQRLAPQVCGRRAPRHRSIESRGVVEDASESQSRTKTGRFEEKADWSQPSRESGGRFRANVRSVMSVAELYISVDRGALLQGQNRSEEPFRCSSIAATY